MAALMHSRRLFLACAASLLAAPALARSERGRMELASLASMRRNDIRLPPGVTVSRGATLAPGTRLIADRAGSTLRLVGDGPLIRVEGADRVEIENVAFEGVKASGHDGGLIEARDVGAFVMEGCVIRNAARDAIRLERCGGKITRCSIRGAGRAGLFSLDSHGLALHGLHVEEIGDNAIQIWTSTPRHDGSTIVDCRIHKVSNRSGGNGQNGNGVSIFRAGGVVAKGNRISNCAFSALRNNGGRDVSFLDNACVASGETAIFAEFGYRDVTIRNNLIDGGSSGIQMTNFADAGGRGGVCADNVIRNIQRYFDAKAPEWGSECAIKVEAETLVARNRVEGAPWVGVLTGWGPSLKDVRVEDNVIRDAPIGVAVSVAPGAGFARIARNRIENARDGGVVAMRWMEKASGDLTKEANRFPTIALDANITT
jgi:uncharacterized secreted repeat protein (TIGR03808 family)